MRLAAQREAAVEQALDARRAVLQAVRRIRARAVLIGAGGLELSPRGHRLECYGDRDAKFGALFDRAGTGVGARVIRTPVRALRPHPSPRRPSP